MKLPHPRGDLSNALVKCLPDGHALTTQSLADITANDDSDAQLSLWILYQLHHDGFDDVDPEMEWYPYLIDVRTSLESQFEQLLRSRYSSVPFTQPFADALFDYIREFEGPSIAQFVKSKATEDQVRELMSYRSVYHLRESDPQAWLIPRLPYDAKASLAELQFDEFGQGRADRLHANIFARGMSDLGLDNRAGAYVDIAPVEVLELNNAMSFFGLHLRLLGAALGHLAAFEATSSAPSRKVAQGLHRLSLAPSMIEYYDEHVEADAVHEQLVIRLICEPVLRKRPELAQEIFFGAFTCMDLEARFAAWLLTKWNTR